MAYARIQPDVCDLYVYKHIRGGYECACPSGMGERMTAKKMLNHISIHFNEGLKVPYELISAFGLLAEGLDVPHSDPAIVDMVKQCRASNPPGKIFSWDADVPESFRISMKEMEELMNSDEPPKVTTTSQLLAETALLLQRDEKAP